MPDTNPLRSLFTGGRAARRAPVQETASGPDPDPTPAPQPVEPTGPVPRHDPVPPMQPFPPGRYVFVTGSVPIRPGGRTNAILMKTRMLAEHGVSSTIAMFEFSSRLPAITDRLRTTGRLAEGVDLVSIYGDYVDAGPFEPDPTAHPVAEDGLVAARNSDAEIYRYFEGGVYRLYKQYDDDGTLLYRDTFNPNRCRVQRDEFYPDGAVCRTTFYDLSANLPRQQVYFRHDGTPSLNVWRVIDSRTKTDLVQRVTVFGDSGEPTRVFPTRQRFFHEFLDRLTGQEEAFVSVEARRCDLDVLSYHRRNVHQIYVAHNPHLSSPYKDPTAVRPQYTDMLSRRRRVGATVFLTAAQRADAEFVYGHEDSFAVIPHPVAPPKPPEEPVTRDPNLAIMLARLVPQKRLDHAIRAFAKVVDINPDARLEIYGHGVERDRLQGLIDTLGVGASVRLAGYLASPSDAYRRATLSLCTSRYEGFGLVVQEALAHGCPVVSYDIRYGPSDLIEDGVNGLLVPAGSITKLAAAIRRVLDDSDLAGRMSAAGPAHNAEFGMQAYAARWSQLFNQVASGRADTSPRDDGPTEDDAGSNDEE